MPHDAGPSSGGSTPPPHERERAALERLARQGGESLVRDIAAIYLAEMPERLAIARSALASADASLLARAAHSMKSSSAQLGAEMLAEACEATETAAERGDLRGAEAHLSVVQGRYASFGAWLATRTGPGDGSADRPGPRGGGPTIAVVEDNADNRLLVEALLGDRFILHEYVSGRDALAGIQSRRPDVVLLDISLPGMDGLEVLARIRGDVRLRDIPVVALTAHAMAGDRERYIATGFDEYVAKPVVDEAALLGAVERLLARQREQRARVPGTSRNT